MPAQMPLPQFADPGAVLIGASVALLENETHAASARQRRRGSAGTRAVPSR